MIRTYSQMHRADNYSQHSSIIWPVWRNGCVFVYEFDIKLMMEAKKKQSTFLVTLIKMSDY